MVAMLRTVQGKAMGRLDCTKQIWEYDPGKNRSDRRFETWEAASFRERK